jgi:hypothetical protein
MTYLLEVPFIIFIPQRRVEVDNQVGSALRQSGWCPLLRVLDVLLDERNTQHLQLLLLPFPRRGQTLRDADVQQGVKLFKGTDFLWFVVTVCLGLIRDVEELGRIVKDGCAFFDPRREVTVHAEDVICDCPVVFFIHVVGDDEKKIETR